ncbi:prephenate dehydrogenase [Shewanella sp. A3A]|uniref:Prephenate dehydrogenase n=1 Tax=Shewanella electrica TaxID=515560 RepID=A0ABT2FP47_9GAMM|nr:prephenate dehydrogenase [Shewanella electrica]MCH1920086.1 prephenate dehydrogenase [Shewanella ferrihydritica]MCH1925635.1 prephenate dehydrogenase [Shewanella electrica]MCS4558117.1 prephenate dehydrogenase [Shewanella electrica]
MPYGNVITQLKTNLQTAYRQAVDADAKLDQLQQAGHGKFSKIFGDEQGFTTKSTRFLPYVQELAEAVTQLEQQADKALLESVVKRLALLLSTLVQFKEQSRQ